MQGRARKIDDKILLEVKNDGNGSLLFAAIQQGNAERLEDLIFHGANVNVLRYDGYPLLQFAAQQEQWGCVLILINEVIINKHKYDYISQNFFCSVGLSLLLAAKCNKNEVVAALTQLVEILPEFYSTLKAYLFFKLKANWPTIMEGLWKDEEKGYTALQWAVENNNIEMCQAISRFATSIDHKIFKSKDKLGLDALSLAVRKMHLECAQEIAKGMTIEYMLEHCPGDVICNVVLNDIRFHGYNSGSKNGSMEFAWKYRLFRFADHVDSIIKSILNHIFSLPNEDKQAAIRLALRDETTLGQIINYNVNSKRYIKQLTSELADMLKEEHIKPVSYSDSETSRSKLVSLNSDSNGFDLVPVYIRTSDLYTFLPNVPKHKVMDSKSLSPEDEAPLIRKIANRNTS